MTEKIGIISDMHGNYEYLKIVVEQLLSENVSRFIFVGDIVTDFPGTKKIMHLVRKLEKLYKVDFVLGNRDKDMIERQQGKRDFWNEEYQNGNLLLAYEDLSLDDLEWLKQIPEYKVIEFPNKEKALVSHISNKEEVKEIINSSNIDILIFGDSHRMCNEDNRKNNGIWYINPGSVGLSEDGIPYGGTYGVLNVSKDKIEYEQRKFVADQKTIDRIYEEINSNKRLKKSHWDLILDLSMQTGRNLAATYFGEIQRLTGLYSKDKDERMKNGFYNLLPIEKSLVTGYNYDIDNNPFSFRREYHTLGSKTFINEKAYNKNFTSNMKVLDDNEARKEIYHIALNNILYYATIYESTIDNNINRNSVQYKSR